MTEDESKFLQAWPTRFPNSLGPRSSLVSILSDRSGVSEIDFLSHKYLKLYLKSISKIETRSLKVINDFNKINKDFSKGIF